jgi:hypothetical protein
VKIYVLTLLSNFFCLTRLIINQINKVQWVDFMLENVLVSLHSLKTMGLSSPVFVSKTENNTNRTITHLCLHFKFKKEVFRVCVNHLQIAR